MKETLHPDARVAGATGRGFRTNELALGLLGGLEATIVIDLITAAVLPLTGSPADSGFTIIGDTAAGFFALFGLNVAGGVPLGVVLHYLIGLALAVIFVAAVQRIADLRPTSIRKGLGLGILYAETISLPILVTPPIILHWSASAAAFWFGFSLVMHAIWGTVLGVAVSRWMRSA